MNSKKISMSVAAAAMFLTFALVSVETGFAQANAGKNALVGTWLVQLTPQSNDPTNPPSQELMTFSSGGTIVESNNFPFSVLGLSAGPGHGTWSFDGEQQYPFTFIKFLFSPAGTAAGTLRVSGTLTYSKSDDTWSGPAVISICDTLADNCIPTGITDGHATRVAAVPE